MPQFPGTERASDTRPGFNCFLSSVPHEQPGGIFLLTSHPVTQRTSFPVQPGLRHWATHGEVSSEKPGRAVRSALAHETFL